MCKSLITHYTTTYMAAECLEMSVAMQHPYFGLIQHIIPFGDIGGEYKVPFHPLNNSPQYAQLWSYL